jgi:C4-dicarboxylate-specific signal transduction histidine kinase
MSTWAATLAHELNQPLSAIVNYMGAARLLSRKEVISSKLWIVSRVRERQPSARAK